MEILGPLLHVVALQSFLHGCVPRLLFFPGHLYGLVQGLCDLFKVIGIDQQGLVHFICRARHFTEDQYAGLIRACGNILFGHQVHAIPDSNNT